MFNAQEFFRKRFSEHFKELSRYLKYIFNGHIVIVMLFIISALVFYYQQWLMDIPEGFPSIWVMAILMGFVASYSPIQTLLKEPDLVFLLPAEHKMGPYFRYTLIYSFVIQLYLVLLVFAGLGPLYFTEFTNHTSQEYILLLVLVLVFKVWNLFATWWMLKIRNPQSRVLDQIARTLLSIVTVFFYLQGELVLAVITTGLLLLLMLYAYSLSKRQAGLCWDLLVEKDRLKMHTFYRIANLFTDVPHLKNQTKKRHWLVALLIRSIPFRQLKSYDYLYRITTVRSGDYLGMYVRLLIIGSLCIIYIPSIWIKMIFAILFIYLSGFQLTTLWQHHRTVAWIDLYPIPKNVRQQSFITWLLQLMIANTFVFGLVFLLIESWIGVAVIWLGGSIFSYLFVHGYVRKQLA
ncbi:ABC transporter permease [Radiobacillus kanasensis]|uniref:ABC transporter permease n=1 Tax=Radiobacillus kanasensis TaxID=2844358 RepID=UPI001E402BF1|nr:ABC transporter permease [Radiobacillus kanasensis]UFU00493.1 ABC transporter permease [Radiobacillus kanasensis]